jgi:hypothetical protein
MALQIDTVTQACRQLTRQIRENYKSLTVHFVPHHDGQRFEALGMTAQEIIHHPAADTAIHLMQKSRMNEDSSLLGTVLARKNIFFGLAWREDLLSLCTINIDHFKDVKDTQMQSWHLAWHAIDAYHYHHKGESSKSAGLDKNIVVRRRNTLQIARANLQADIFSAIMCTFLGDRDSWKRIGITRAQNILEARSIHMPEFYPYVIALESLEYCLSTFLEKVPSRRQMIPTALKIARDINKSIDDETLTNWFSFCGSAQDMAWRGFKKEHIISAAINTSPDTFIRTTGHLLKEVIQIDSASFLDISDSYSPFADDSFNQNLHEKMIEQIFEDVITKGISLHSSEPFIKLANKQNEELTEGRILGWCASALQSAGRTLEKSDRSSKHIEAAVRQELRDEKNHTEWTHLQDLGRRVVEHQREGEIITLAKLSEIAGEGKAGGIIQGSIDETIKDPEYQKRLQHLQTQAPRMPAPATPAPKSVPKMAMAPAYAVPSAPGLGGGRGAPVRQQARPAKKTADDEKGDKDRKKK